MWTLTAVLAIALVGLPPQGGPPLRVGELVEAPARVKHVEAETPRDAVRAGLAGDVVLDCVIDPKGRVSDVRVLEGVPPLTDAAVEAVERWRFEPTVVDGAPVPVVMTVTVPFRLDGLQFHGLLGSLDEENEHLRLSAVGWLGRLETGSGLTEKHIQTVVEALEPLAEEDGSPRVRTAAARALSQLDGRPLPPVRPAVRPVAWGEFVDPLGRSEARETEGGVEIAVPPGLYDLSIEIGGVTAPRLLRPVDGDFAAEVEVGRISSAAGRGTPDRRAYHGAGLLLWEDEENYVRLETATYRQPLERWDTPLVDVRYVLFEQRAGGDVVGALDPARIDLDDAPATLRLERRGNEVRAFVRQDGEAWRDVGYTKVPLDHEAQIGVTAVNTAESALVAHFRGFRLSDPGPTSPPMEDVLLEGPRGEESTAGGDISERRPPRTIPVRVGGKVPEPRKLRHVDPVYPAAARQAGLQGIVILECTIDTQGKTTEVKVLRGSGSPQLDQAAVDAVTQWEYEPTLLNGVPVPVIMTVSVRFKL